MEEFTQEDKDLLRQGVDIMTAQISTQINQSKKEEREPLRQALTKMINLGSKVENLIKVK